MLSASQGQLEERTRGLGQAPCTSGQEVDLPATAAHPGPDPAHPDRLEHEGPDRASARAHKNVLWLRGLDLNQRPLGYEPNELPDCSTPRLNSMRVPLGCQGFSPLAP